MIPTQDMTLDTIVAEVAARREEFDRLCYVPRDMIEKMIAIGIFRSSVPRRFGGDAVPPHEFLPIVERISEADGSAGWVAGFGSANVYLAALPAETQAIIYKQGPDQVFGGGLYPLQPAVAVDGGWEVTGQWRFASGCKAADWLGVGIGGTLANSGDPSAGKPLTAVFPASEVAGPAATTCVSRRNASIAPGRSCGGPRRRSTSRCIVIRPSRTRHRCILWSTWGSRARRSTW
jgi:alkylation response protein AidB-like acyl-CoA dehydrogenase